MPSKKRRRSTAANADAQHHRSSQSVPLAGFSTLPCEIRSIIVQMACHSPSSSSLSPFEADNGTMFTLALVCKELNAQVSPLLHATVAITRPSALYALHQSLSAFPSHAELITSLHIGPQDSLPSYWWPLSMVSVAEPTQYHYDTTVGQSDLAFPSHWIASSLDQESLPSGCQTRQAWEWHRSTAGCRGAAIFAALAFIKDSFALDVRGHGRTETTAFAPALEAQAALDIYLTKIRSMEEKDPELARLAKPGARVPLACRNGGCSHYPALRLSGVPRTSIMPVPPLQKAFILPYSQVLCHLARPGALTDRFDHPLILSRSGFDVSIMVPVAGKGPKTAYFPSKASYNLHSNNWALDHHEKSSWAGEKVLRKAGRQKSCSAEDKGRYAAAATTATVGAILGLARAVLRSAASVKNLSLSGGYLEWAIDTAHRASSCLSRLHRLSLGPQLPCWGGPLPVRWLDSVEELRICGRSLTKYEAWAVVAKVPNLKRMEWSLGGRFTSRIGQDVGSIVLHLMQHSTVTPAAATAGARQEDVADSGHSAASLLVVRLHPADTLEVLQAAISPEVKDAWLNGRPTSSYFRRLLLKDSVAAAVVAAVEPGVSNPSQDSNSCVWREMYLENQRFWRGERETLRSPDKSGGR